MFTLQPSKKVHDSEIIPVSICFPELSECSGFVGNDFITNYKKTIVFNHNPSFLDVKSCYGYPNLDNLIEIDAIMGKYDLIDLIEPTDDVQSNEKVSNFNLKGISAIFTLLIVLLLFLVQFYVII